MSESRNIKVYYWYSVFTELVITAPINVVYLLSRGLSFTQIMLLQSIYAVSMVLLEVPTGAVADKYGRKFSIILAHILFPIGMILYIIGGSFFVFALGEIVLGLSCTFKSGADSALLYDSLKIEGREADFVKIEGRARSYTFYAQALGSILSGFLFKINILLPYITTVIFIVIAGIITTFFKETHIDKNFEEKKLSYFEQIIESGKFVLSHNKVRTVVLFSMMFFVFYRTGFWYFQPYMKAVNIPVEYFGIIFFLFGMVAAQASRYSSKIIGWTKPRTLTFMAALMIISFFIMSVTTVWIGVFAIFLQQAARAIYRPTISKYINKHTSSQKRATVLSFQSLAANIAVAVTYPIMGLLQDNAGVFSAHLILGALMLVLTVGMAFHMNKYLGLEKGTFLKNQEGLNKQ